MVDLNWNITILYQFKIDYHGFDLDHLLLRGSGAACSLR